MNQKGLPLTILYINLLMMFLFQVRNATLTLRSRFTEGLTGYTLDTK